jgi:hypothetical protein
VQIPDDYSTKEKEDALELAEATLEADVNDGYEIAQENVTVLMKSAIKQRATCELAKGSEHPDDVALGDLADDGTTKSDYAQTSFCEAYDDLVDKILQSESWGDTGGTSSDPYVYNTKKPVNER